MRPWKWGIWIALALGLLLALRQVERPPAESEVAGGRREGLEDRNPVSDQIRAKQQVAAEVRGGRLTLLEAADRFRALDACWGEPGRQPTPESLCWDVIFFVRSTSPPDEARAAGDRLEAELRERLRAGTLSLPRVRGEERATGRRPRNGRTPAMNEKSDRLELDRLLVAEEGLEAALAAGAAGREAEWVRDVGRALNGVKRALRKHRSDVEAPGGLVAEEQPGLAPRVGELYWEHAHLFRLADLLQRGAELAAEVIDHRAGRNHAAECCAGTLAAVRQQAAGLLDSLRRHQAEEALLVLQTTVEA